MRSLTLKEGLLYPIVSHRCPDFFNRPEELLVCRGEVKSGWLSVTLHEVNCDARSKGRCIGGCLTVSSGPMLDAGGEEAREYLRRRFEIGDDLDTILLFLLIL